MRVSVRHRIFEQHGYALSFCLPDDKLLMGGSCTSETICIERFNIQRRNQEMANCGSVI